MPACEDPNNFFLEQHFGNLFISCFLQKKKVVCLEQLKQLFLGEVAVVGLLNLDSRFKKRSGLRAWRGGEKTRDDDDDGRDGAAVHAVGEVPDGGVAVGGVGGVGLFRVGRLWLLCRRVQARRLFRQAEAVCSLQVIGLRTWWLAKERIGMTNRIFFTWRMLPLWVGSVCFGFSFPFIFMRSRPVAPRAQDRHPKK